MLGVRWGKTRRVFKELPITTKCLPCVCFAVTQGWYTLLQSHTARTMLANSELVVMLNQATTDREQLAELMGISDLQMSYITNAEAGHGLAKIGGALVPFVNHIPANTKLYELMSTKFNEVQV